VLGAIVVEGVSVAPSSPDDVPVGTKHSKEDYLQRYETSFCIISDNCLSTSVQKVRQEGRRPQRHF